MADHTPSAWIKPRDIYAGTGYFTAWSEFKTGLTSQTYKDVYLAATAVPPDVRCMDIIEDFSMHIAILRLKRAL